MDYTSIIEGTVKFRDGKKQLNERYEELYCDYLQSLELKMASKRRYMLYENKKQETTEIDCLHLQLYRDSKDRYKQGQTKASLSLQHFLGIESGFTLDKESNTIAILCQDVTVVLAFDTRERLIQWQVKIANNLGEDQQYLIQIASAPARAKISPGPARIHVREFRFSLTMGVPPRLIGVWDIRQLRRYGVVENRFCFEGGSSCGRLEGLYVFVTDQGEEITKTFKMASEGKLAIRRKPVSRNMSVMESPRRTLQQRLLGLVEQVNPQSDMGNAGSQAKNSDGTIWESAETTACCDYGDTASVGETADAQESVGWAPDIGIGRCASCISKLGAMSRSSTIVQTPGTGFTPVWIMEESAKSQQKEMNTACNASIISQVSSSDSHGTSSSDTSSGCDCRSRAVSPCRQICCCGQQYIRQVTIQEQRQSCRCQAKPDCPTAVITTVCHVTSTTCSGGCGVTNAGGPPQQYENYDVPKTLCARIKGEKSADESTHKLAQEACQEYYDTPRKIKEHINKKGLDEVHQCNLPVHRRPIICSIHQCHKRVNSDGSCNCQRFCQNCAQSIPSNNIDNRLSLCEESLQSYTTNGAIYAKVDLQKKTKRNEEKTEPISGSEVPKEQPKINYENLEFAQSLEHYENVKDFAVKLQQVKSTCPKCSCESKPPSEDDYLVMGPICENNREEVARMRTSVLSYLPMNPITTKHSQATCQCPAKETSEEETVKVSRPGPDFDQSKSACASPFLRRHIEGSCYSSIEGRRLAAIRRRSNSVDSGRYYEGLDCISERTASSPSASIDSIPCEIKEIPEKEVVVREPAVRPEPPAGIARRPPHVPSKTAVNRDSSSSNDSGVSTGSLKHCEFMEFETLITPLSKVRHHSLSNRDILLAPPRRSKSSDPLQDLSFQFEKTSVAPKSSSAEAEVPVNLIKKEITKEFSVSSSSGGLTIPYMDSISTSSGTSDMSDYIDTLSMSSYSSSETADNLRLCHSAATILRPRSGKEYQKIDRYNIEDETGKNSNKISAPQNADSPSLGYISSTSSN